MQSWGGCKLFFVYMAALGMSASSPTYRGVAGTKKVGGGGKTPKKIQAPIFFLVLRGFSENTD